MNNTLNDIPIDIRFRSFNIFGDISFNEHDFYYMFYPERPISKEHRKELKEMGWQLQRYHKREHWVWMKEEGRQHIKEQKEVANGIQV